MIQESAVLAVESWISGVLASFHAFPKRWVLLGFSRLIPSYVSSSLSLNLKVIILQAWERSNFQ